MTQIPGSIQAEDKNDFSPEFLELGDVANLAPRAKVIRKVN